MLSKFSRPSAAIRLRTPASTIAPTGPPSAATLRPATAHTRSETLNIVSSRTRVRTFEATALPAIAATADSPTTAANHAVPWSCDRSQNARWKNVNPTIARNTVMAIAASSMFPVWSSRDSSASATSAATTSDGSRVAAMNDPAKSSALNTRVAGAPLSLSRAAAGMTTTAPVSPAIRPSFEFASTSSVSDLTVEGTIADFDTA